MNRKVSIYVVLIVVVLAIIIIIDATRPKPVDWSQTYDPNDKIPFGLFVFDKELPALFDGHDVNKFNITPYEYFDGQYDYETKEYTAHGSFIAISALNNLDAESAMELIYFAEHGNTVFLSMHEFPQKILDTLKVETQSVYYLTDSISTYINTAKAGKYYLKEGASPVYFKSIDTAATTVLGYQEIIDQKQVNYISVPFGDGNFLLHTQPAAFSNFHLLKDDHYKYAQDILSYMPEADVYWNTGSNLNERISGSPLRYILNQPALHAAFWVAFWSLIIFMFFNAKRKQRIVPETEPLKNTTIDFTKTIGNLYYQEKDHRNIIDKKIIYFLEKIRNEYLIDTYSLDDAFAEKLHLKSGKPLEDIEKIINLIKKHRRQFASTEADVIEINKAIEKLRL
ncbi:DUF4350 domain-containing protein [Flavobacterium sp.]|uniref:DUF4350 domain-containing protein n=1 Tax=Flavobacterium sp. TaxID=239 RepID=UPI00262D326A|nr:DUF4350 domain-containing protein [Flavobacterium sp.]